MNLDDYHYQHLIPRTLKEKEDILDVTHDIEYSLTGRVDVMGLHSFFVEASSLLRNSVKQYEQGFFDGAFYSIRTALELTRIITHFSHQDEPTESDIYKTWVQGDRFPPDGAIRKELNKAGAVYNEVREALPDFFDNQDERLKKVQKYIHKQSYKTFHNHTPFRPDVRQSRIQKVDELFLEFIVNSIIEIAILRLCIDPFPLLLKDESVMYKIHFQSLTTPYSDKLVEMIGVQNIKSYRNTDFYISHHNSYIHNEELHEATYNLMNSEFYDRSAQDLIMNQAHLLSKDDLVAIKLFDISDDITRVFLNSGLSWYFSNTKSSRKNLGFNGEHMHHLMEAGTQVNVALEGAYISFFLSGQSRCWIEHNNKLNQQKVIKMTKTLDEYDKKNQDF